MSHIRVPHVRVPGGLQCIGAGWREPRHRHDGAYAALVLKGGYEECGSRGRVQARSGDILFHGAFEGHCDSFGIAGAEILNLPLPKPVDIAVALCRDISAVLSRAHSDPHEAAWRMIEEACPATPVERDWPDMLVGDLWRCDALSLSDWAARHGLSAETLSRGLKRVYGVAPAVLRREIRAQKAWRRIMENAEPLAAIAADLGFSDQAHMSRDVVRLTGRPPSHWRHQIPSTRVH